MLIYSEPFSPSIFLSSFSHIEIKQSILKHLNQSDTSFLEHTAFIDIETTGLSAKSSHLYLIGIIFYQNHSFYYKQWFLEDPNEEKDVLKSFFTFLSNYKTIIHFNGTTFDLPYLLHKCERYCLPYTFDSYQSIDLYQLLRPLKKILKLPNCKQKSFEIALDIDRLDRFDGGMLIEIYQEYLERKESRALHLLLLHNKEDIMHIPDLCSLIPYLDLLDASFLDTIHTQQISATLEKAKNLTQDTLYELHIKIDCDIYNLIFLHYRTDLFQFITQKDSVHLLIYSSTTEFKNYYPDYKNYYYLPAEDTAIHKSVSSYVDKSHRIKATRKNCYGRFQCTEQFLSDKNALLSYTKNILKSRL